MKSLKIEDQLHIFLKKYCKKNHLKMGHWIESILLDYLKNNNIYDINRECENKN